MDKLQLCLLIVQIIVAAIMIFIVLIQRSDGDSLSGIGGGSGGLNSVMSSKASSSVLVKITMFLVAIFMLNCLVLALISSKASRSDNMQIDKVLETQKGDDSLGNHAAPSAPLVE